MLREMTYRSVDRGTFLPCAGMAIWVLVPPWRLFVWTVVGSEEDIKREAVVADLEGGE